MDDNKNKDNQTISQKKNQSTDMTEMEDEA